MYPHMNELLLRFALQSNIELMNHLRIDRQIKAQSSRQIDWHVCILVWISNALFSMDYKTRPKKIAPPWQSPGRGFMPTS